MSEEDSAPPKIVVIEDDPSIAMLLEYHLSQISTFTTIFTSPKEAINSVAFAEADVILTDMSMPGIDGFQVLHTAIRVNPKARRIVLTARSSRSFTSEEKELMEKEQILLLEKPISTRRLREAIEGEGA